MLSLGRFPEFAIYTICIYTFTGTYRIYIYYVCLATHFHESNTRYVSHQAVNLCLLNTQKPTVTSSRCIRQCIDSIDWSQLM